MTDSTNNSFENQWQNAFDDAELTPPASVWEKIESGLTPENTHLTKPNFGNKPHYFLGGIMVGLLGLFFWFNDAEKESQVVEKEVVKSNIIIKNEPIMTVDMVGRNINHGAKKYTPLSVFPQTTNRKILDVVGEHTNHGAELSVEAQTTAEGEYKTNIEKYFTDSVEIITPLTTKSIHSEIEKPNIILPIDQTPYYAKPIPKSQKKSIFKNVKISAGAGVYQQ